VREAARTRWTDEGIDDLARRIEIHDSWGTEFGRIGAAVERLELQLGELRAEARGDIRELRRWVINLWATVGLGIAGLLVEIAVR
jgi:hypothetical protein